MRYMGSKARIAKDILPLILENRKKGQWYVEPFCGGCNTLSEVRGNRIGCDIHPYLIEMWKGVSEKGWIPPKFVTEQEYDLIKLNKDLDPILSGYVGFELAFGNKWMGSYVTYQIQDKWKRRHKDEVAYENSLKQFPKLKGVLFLNLTYFDLNLTGLGSCIVYCDPPYANTATYANGKFNTSLFFEWCRKMVDQGHRVFISEYEAPDDFICIWGKEQRAGMGGGNKRAIEKLFIHESQLRDYLSIDVL
jgi:DNA adenine methylase